MNDSRNSIDIDFVISDMPLAERVLREAARAACWRETEFRDGLIFLVPSCKFESIDEIGAVLEECGRELRSYQVREVLLRMAVYMDLTSSTLQFDRSLLSIIVRHGWALEVSTYPVVES